MLHSFRRSVLLYTQGICISNHTNNARTMHIMPRGTEEKHKHLVNFISTTNGVGVFNIYIYLYCTVRPQYLEVARDRTIFF